MVIERTNKEILLRLTADMDITGLQRIINYLQYKEYIMKSEGTEEPANQLANESKRRWWTENKERFFKKGIL